MFKLAGQLKNAKISNLLDVQWYTMICNWTLKSPKWIKWRNLCKTCKRHLVWCFSGLCVPLLAWWHFSPETWSKSWLASNTPTSKSLLLPLEWVQLGLLVALFFLGGFWMKYFLGQDVYGGTSSRLIYCVLKIENEGFPASYVCV